MTASFEPRILQRDSDDVASSGDSPSRLDGCIGTDRHRCDLVIREHLPRRSKSAYSGPKPGLFKVYACGTAGRGEGDDGGELLTVLSRGNAGEDDAYDVSGLHGRLGGWLLPPYPRLCARPVLSLPPQPTGEASESRAAITGVPQCRHVHAFRVMRRRHFGHGRPRGGASVAAFTGRLQKGQMPFLRVIC